MASLIDNLRGTTFVVIDFEALTPAGRPAEPTEVAALALVVRDSHLVEAGRFEPLIQPLPDVPITPRDLAHGMSEAALRRAPSAATVLAGLDQHLTAPPYRLVAQHAATEAGLIARRREHCPTLATIKLAEQVTRGMPSYGLDGLLRYYGIPRPRGRHRAMPDVEVTSRSFDDFSPTGHKPVTGPRCSISTPLPGSSRNRPPRAKPRFKTDCSTSAERSRPLPR